MLLCTFAFNRCNSMVELCTGCFMQDLGGWKRRGNGVYIVFKIIAFTERRASTGPHRYHTYTPLSHITLTLSQLVLLLFP